MYLKSVSDCFFYSIIKAIVIVHPHTHAHTCNPHNIHLRTHKTHLHTLMLLTNKHILKYTYTFLHIFPSTYRHTNPHYHVHTLSQTHTNRDTRLINVHSQTDKHIQYTDKITKYSNKRNKHT